MMMKKRVPVWLIGFICAACTSLVLASTLQTEDLAIKAAEEWLKIVDSGDYDESWQQSSEFLRKAISQDDWRTALQTTRDSLGSPISRKVKSADFMTSLPGAPDGEYVVIQFETSFELKKSAVETITPKKDSDGTWRVSGYFIR